MKKIILGLIVISISIVSEAQMLIPEFVAPNKMEALAGTSDETMLIPFNQGNNFYFFRTYSNKKGEVFAAAIWFAEKKNNEWDKPYRLFREGDLVGNNELVGASADGKRIYVLNKLQSTVEKEIVETQRLIYMDRKEKEKEKDPDEWEEPVEIVIPNFEFGNLFYSFQMSSEGDVLMIAMSESESRLQQDLYVSLKQEDGSWSEIINLGNKINTRKDETSPYLAEDKKTLYFSSAGHDGLGGMDIFVSYRIGDGWEKWTRPLNLGAPINSEDQDAYFIIGDSMDIYYASDRGDGKGDVYMNIYHTTTTGEFKFANQSAQFDFAKLPADGLTIKIYDTDGNFIDEVQTDIYGNFTFKKLEADEYYLFKVDDVFDEDFVGSKVYFVNDEGEKTRRFIYTEEGQLTNSDQIIGTKKVRGSFNYKDLPMAGTALLVLDEKGFPIDTIYTDENGKFEYKLLAYDTKFSILPLNLKDEELVDLSMNMENGNGEVLQNGYFDGKKFKFRRLSADGIDLAEESTIDEGMIEFFGRFNYKSLPMANTALVVLDENGLAIDTIYTDAYGNFNYKKLANDKEFSITPLDLTDVGYDELEILLANGNGTVFQKGLYDGSNFKFTALDRDDFKLDVADLVDKDKEVIELYGRFDYKQLPMSKVALLVLDEDGFPIDTIYTDANGNFNYKKLAGDKEFSIVPLNLTDEELNDLSMTLLNKEGKSIQKGLFDGSIFKFTALDRDDFTLDVADVVDKDKELLLQSTKAEKEPAKVEEKPAKKVDAAQESAESWNGKGDVKAVVYFEFAVNELDEVSKASLDKMIDKLKGQKIILVGHTDNIGTVENNRKRGIERATAVERYLESKGITIDKIELSSKGEIAPIAPNDYAKGRAKNRRVELIIK